MTSVCPHCGESITADTPQEVPEELQIDFPTITVNGKEYDSISLRAPTFNEVRTSKKGKKDEEEIALTLLSKVAGVDPTIIDKMPLHKVEEALDYVMGFSAARRKIG